MDYDVIIVGAGLSGIGAACRLTLDAPGTTFALLEARGASGGTWDLFRYPGVRSDSDMFTLSYPFHPWKGDKAIASGESILAYIRETAATFGVDPHIRYRHRVVSARWSSADARWTLEVEVGEEKRVERFRCRFLYSCSGYYSYEAAHAPVFPDRERFRGRIVHPQWWPADLEYAGKRVVVIGSGATAVTIVPSMAERAAHVTMLQRSPTYILSRPDVDVVANYLRGRLPGLLGHGLARMKNVLLGLAFYQWCRRYPKQASRLLRGEVAKQLPPGYPVSLHFKPRYVPWDERLCLVPNNDLFAAIRAGKATMVTDTIERFTETGIRLASGEELEADIIVTATGLALRPLGGVTLEVDGRPIAAQDTMIYRGVLLSGVPNFAWCMGYANASWTLRADLSSRYVCRLLRHMKKKGYRQAVPSPEHGDIARTPILELTSGYVVRAAGTMPLQGDRAPWRFLHNYPLDALSTLLGRIDASIAFA
jgi:monooxygenase